MSAARDDEIVRLRRRSLVAAGCWLWDHEVPSRELPGGRER